MPKIVKYPRLKIVSRRNAAGKVTTHYYYDMRSEGGTYQHLGKDHADALRQWHKFYLDATSHAGTLQEAITSFTEHALPAYTNRATQASYAKHLARIAAVFGHMAWADITVPVLKSYLEQREGKTQANREMSTLSIVWSHARLKGLTALHWPAVGLKGWKNRETARQYKPADDVFEAIYATAAPELRDAMDIASATGMRLTDVRTVLVPAPDVMLAIQASKTGKGAQYDATASQVLPPIFERRRALHTTHDYLLSTPDGRPITERMLRDRFAAARSAAELAAKDAGRPALAKRIAGMIARDCRKIAANKAESLQAAQLLLQHTDARLTARHYRSAVEQLKVVR